MRKAWILGAVLLVAAWTSVGMELSGQWTSGIAFNSGGVSLAQSLTLRLAGPGWGLTSSWNPSLPTLSHHTLALQGSLGVLDWTAGLSLRAAAPAGALPQQARTGTWTWEGLSFAGGFVSLRIVLGNLSLRITLGSEPAE